MSPRDSLILSLARIILKTQNGGLRKKNKHGIPASILNEHKLFSTGPLCIEMSTLGSKFVALLYLKVIDRYVFFSSGVGDKEIRLMLDYQVLTYFKNIGIRRTILTNFITV